MIRLVLPLPPSTNKLYARTRSGGLRLTDKVKVFRLLVNREIADAELKPGDVPAGMLKVTVILMLTSKRKHDIDNTLKSLFDALAATLGFEDDRIVELYVRKLYLLTAKEKPWCSVAIEAAQ